MPHLEKLEKPHKILLSAEKLHKNFVIFAPSLGP